MTQYVNTKVSDGSSFGQSTDDEISFYGVTAVVQPSSTNQSAITAGATTTACNTLVIEMRRVMVLLGLMKGSA